MRIFVYGSLMEGFHNFEKYLVGKVISRSYATTKGTLYHLKNKGYPGFVLDGVGNVHGEIIEIEDDELTISDIYKLEDCVVNNRIDNSYNRKEILVQNYKENSVEYLEAFVYSLDSSKNVNDERILIEHGNWKQYMETV